MGNEEGKRIPMLKPNFGLKKKWVGRVMSFTEIGRLVEEQVWERYQEFSLPCLF